MSDYADFLASKRRDWKDQGLEIGEDGLPAMLFLFQRALTRWALRKGKAALWADTGLGKTFCQVAWADKIPGRVLILAPLCVASQTISEAARLGIAVAPMGRNDARIEITNYERLHQVNPAEYAGIVLDESSILKHHDAKTRTKLIQAFRDTPYRLCCTATPAPNDIQELANHAEFLGVMTRAEMLATFFVHDDEGWRLKGHAAEAFYQWLATWGMFLRKPSDLGFSDDGFILPELRIHEQVIQFNSQFGDALFPSMSARGIRGRIAARRASLEGRLEATESLVRGDTSQWLVYCGLNAEQDALARALGADCVSIAGADSEATKEHRLRAFLEGAARVLISKVSIVGFGLNLQRCNRIAFVGIGDSMEQYYQAIRRCWRYGQASPVDVHIVVSEAETGIVDNVRRKEREHDRMARGLIAAMGEREREELGVQTHTLKAPARRIERGEGWDLRAGDCVEELSQIAPETVDFSVYSPPFASLYTYTASERDIGNSAGIEEFLSHMRYAVRGLLRVTKPGRNTAVHCADLGLTKVAHGVIGLHDLPGDLIRLYSSEGWIYHGRITIQKNPQAQAVRTHAKALLFAQLRKDASWLRPGLADYILIFRKPGNNAVPVLPEISNEDWIAWAHPVWHGIRESNTLNAAEARTERDDRHICPLQLGVIERCIRLWSNAGELVLSPFAGIGSEGYEAVRLGRKFLGIELKSEYFECAVRNLQRAETLAPQMGLFTRPEETP